MSTLRRKFTTHIIPELDKEIKKIEDDLAFLKEKQKKYPVYKWKISHLENLLSYEKEQREWYKKYFLDLLN